MEKNIIVVYGNKFLVASKRIGHDENFIALAEARNEAAAEKLRDALNKSVPAEAPAPSRKKS